MSLLSMCTSLTKQGMLLWHQMLWSYIYRMNISVEWCCWILFFLLNIRVFYQFMNELISTGNLISRQNLCYSCNVLDICRRGGRCGAHCCSSKWNAARWPMATARCACPPPRCLPLVIGLPLVATKLLLPTLRAVRAAPTAAALREARPWHRRMAATRRSLRIRHRRMRRRRQHVRLVTLLRDTSEPDVFDTPVF